MDVVSLTDAEDPAYEAFLHRCDDALVYYSPRYRRFLVDLLDCEPAYLAAMEDGQIEAVFPIMVRKGPHGTVMNALPFYGSYGSVIGRNPAARDVLCRRYNEMTRREGMVASTVVMNPLSPAQDAKIAFDVTDQRIGQMSRLPAEELDVEAAIFRDIDGSARRNIKKARASRVSVRVENGATDFLEDCHRRNIEGIGGKPKGPQFFELLPRHFVPDQDYRLYVAEIDGQLAAGLLVLYYNRTVEYFVPATASEHRVAQPLALCIHDAMVDAARAGFRRWNWGGTWVSQTGVYQFKKKWNAVDYPYSYLTTINNKALLGLSRVELMRAYPEFFVLPFGHLEP